MSFTDQKSRVATAKDLVAPWSGHKDGSHFYCSLCGHSFEEGEQWRWVYAGRVSLPNIMVCKACDGDNVLERWKTLNEEWDSFAKGKFRFVATLIADLEYDCSRM